MPRKRARQYRQMARTRRLLADKPTRETLAAQMKVAYERGRSIRDLAQVHKLAFATVRTLLIEAGAVLRSRGGANRTRRQEPEP